MGGGGGGGVGGESERERERERRGGGEDRDTLYVVSEHRCVYVTVKNVLLMNIMVEFVFCLNDHMYH